MGLLVSDPHPATLLLEAIGCLTLWYITSSIIAWYRLRHISGPFLASFSYLWIARVTNSGKQYEIYRDLYKDYDSSLVRIGPNDLTTDDPDVIRMMSSAKSLYWKGEANTGNRFNPYHENMFIMLEPERHDKMKAKVAAAYSGRDTPALETNVDDQVQNLINLIRQKYLSKPGETRILPLGHVSALFTLDVISKVSLGNEFGCLQSDRDIHEFYSTLRSHMPFMSLTIDVPWLRKFFYSDIFLKLMGPKETDPHGMGKLMGLTNDVVRKRFAPGAKPEKNMLVSMHIITRCIHTDWRPQGSFIRHGLTQQECESEALFMFIAGSDTTAAVMRVTMMHVLSNPKVYQNVKNEVATAIREGRASSPITNAEGKSLPYLQVSSCCSR